MRNKKVLWITRTAIFIALLIVIQYATKALSQYVTGSLVNLLLVTAALTAGLASGLTVALLSPFFAFFFGIGPAFIQLVPFVALGNGAIVLVVWLIKRGGAGKDTVRSVIAVIAGALAKFAVLWLGVVRIMLPLIPGIKPAQVEKMTAMFTWPQLVTATIGAALAMAVAPMVARAIKGKA